MYYTATKKPSLYTFQTCLLEFSIMHSEIQNSSSVSLVGAANAALGRGAPGKPFVTEVLADARSDALAFATAAVSALRSKHEGWQLLAVVSRWQACLVLQLSRQ